MSSKELLAAHKASSNESGKAHYTDIVKTLASTKNTPKKSTNRVSLGLGLGNLDPLAAMTEAVTTYIFPVLVVVNIIFWGFFLVAAPTCDTC